MRRLANAFLSITLVASGIIAAQSPKMLAGQQRPAPKPGVKADRGIYPMPAAPALPSAGGKFTDPTFGTTIMRVTDASDGASNVTAYAFWPSFNSNTSRLFVNTGNGAMLYNFDGNSFAISNKRPLFQSTIAGIGSLFWEDLIWSGTNPDVIYGHTGMRLYSYNVATNTYTLIKDFSSSVSATYLMQMSRSIDDDVFAFHLKNSAGAVVGYIAWKRSTDNLYTAMTSDVNEVRVDKSGRYLMVTTEQGGPVAEVIEVRVVDLQTRVVTDLRNGTPHYAPGHHDVGNGVVIGVDDWNNRYTIRNFGRPTELMTGIGFGADWTIMSHISLLNDDERWALISTFRDQSLSRNGVFRDELFLVAMDGSQRVRRLCHTQSVWRDYWDTPRANISRDGRYAAFTSNWGSATRRDVFIVQIPPVGAEEIAESKPARQSPTSLKPADVSERTSRNSDGSLSSISAREKVVWANLVNCVAEGSGLRKSGGDSQPATAKSQQAIATGDGFVEFAVAEANGTRYCGLARDTSVIDAAAMDFAIKLNASGIAEIRELGDYAGETGYKSGDVFRIAVEGREVKYYKNGSLVFTSLKEPLRPLYVEAVMTGSNSMLGNVTISTGAGKPLQH